jgi:hypothetical protein
MGSHAGSSVDRLDLVDTQEQGLFAALVRSVDQPPPSSASATSAASPAPLDVSSTDFRSHIGFVQGERGPQLLLVDLIHSP